MIVVLLVFRVVVVGLLHDHVPNGLAAFSLEKLGNTGPRLSPKSQGRKLKCPPATAVRAHTAWRVDSYLDRLLETSGKRTEPLSNGLTTFWVSERLTLPGTLSCVGGYVQLEN